MTPFEAASLFVSFAETAQTAFANFMAIVTAMLAGSWFFAHRLTRAMAGAMVFIFSIACLGFGNELFSLYSDLARLGGHLHEIGQAPEAGLAWLGPVRGPANGMAPIPFVVLGLCVASYLAAIWFFFHARKTRGGGKPWEVLED